MRRGFPDCTEERWKNRLNLDSFFRYNKKTEEKLKYAENILNGDKA